MPARALPPLTHHEILARVAPFVRAGFAVDLPASDRDARRVVFRPQPVPTDPALPDGPVTDVLSFDDLGDDGLRLVRTVASAGAGEGHLEVSGSDVASLLAAITALPASAAFLRCGEAWAALDLRLSPQAPGPDAPPPVLRAARVVLPGLALAMSVSGVAGYAAEWTLLRREGSVAAVRRLPDDLLAVLGRAHGLLSPAPGGWRALLALRGREPRRTAEARIGLQMVAAHLARTLAEPPATFAATHRAARWRVALRRVAPWGVGLAVIAAGLAASRAGPRAEAWLAVLANGAPPLLLMWLFLRREMPRLEWPRPPSPLPDDAWVPAAPAAPPPLAPPTP
jgi:hypothetical protein